MTANGSHGEFVALCGGVGGAKLALGLQHVLGERLTVIVNIGDDFDHLGVRICRDLDTVLYTLSGLSDETRGWGRANESWNFKEAVGGLGGETWFRLGDRVWRCIDKADTGGTQEFGAKPFAANTLMVDLDTRIALANDVLTSIAQLSSSRT